MTQKQLPIWQPTGLIQKAFNLAAVQHAQEARKGTGLPYISHLMAVSALVVENGGNEVQAAAALLHDAIEDTDITEDQMSKEIGHEVTKIVIACSSKSFHDPEESDKWLNKQRYLDRLKAKSNEDPSLLVALADKVHNSETCVNEYPKEPIAKVEYWKKFNLGYEKQREWYKGLSERFREKSGLPPALLSRLDVAIDILFH